MTVAVACFHYVADVNKVQGGSLVLVVGGLRMPQFDEGHIVTCFYCGGVTADGWTATIPLTALVDRRASHGILPCADCIERDLQLDVDRLEVVSSCVDLSCACCRSVIEAVVDELLHDTFAGNPPVAAKAFSAGLVNPAPVSPDSPMPLTSAMPTFEDPPAGVIAALLGGGK